MNDAPKPPLRQKPPQPKDDSKKPSSVQFWINLTIGFIACLGILPLTAINEIALIMLLLAGVALCFKRGVRGIGMGIFLGIGLAYLALIAICGNMRF